MDEQREGHWEMKRAAELWAIIWPEGDIVTGMDCTTEKRAWERSLYNWRESEIERSKKRGFRTIKVTLNWEDRNK